MNDLTNAEWLAAQQKAYSDRIDAVAAFWPQFQRACREYCDRAPFQGVVRLHAEAEGSRVLMLSAGLFDLNVACDPVSDTVLFAFTSPTLTRLFPRDTDVLANGVVKLTRGYWGVIDLPHERAPQSFVAEPQAVETLPLADRFARWCFEQLMGGYPAIHALAEERDQRVANRKSESQGEKLRKEHGL